MVNTVSYMAIAPGADDIAHCLFQFLIAGKIQGMCRPSSYRRNIQSSHRPPESLRADDFEQGLHHVAVASGGIRLQTLHPGLEEKKDI